MTNTLRKLIHDRKFNTDKHSAHSYIDYFYEREFTPYQFREITLVEIGVWTGGSLRLWAEYFPNGQIIGVDNHCVYEARYSHPNITLVHGDAYSQEITTQIPSCDIFIDDGSHELPHQCWAVQYYSKKIRPGGLFIIEDVADIAHLEILKSFTPVELRPYIECIDLRFIKNRFDDILFVIRVPSDLV